MRVLLFLLLLLPFASSCAYAQKSAKGPWRAVYQQVRARPEDFGGDGWGSSDTTTTWQRRRVLQKAAWNVSPDSIRLFLNCENPLVAPAAGSRIRFTATGATLRFDAEEGILWIMPFAAQVQLQAYNKRKMVLQQTFSAIPPPLPEFTCFCGLNLSYTKIGREINTIDVRATANPNLSVAMPADARYRVSRVRVTLNRKEIVIDSAEFNGTYDLAGMKSVAQSNDQIHVDVLQIERLNFCGDIEQIPVQRRFILPFSR